MDDGQSFGQLVTRRRKALGLTQSELARNAGYSVSTIRKVESDELRPSQSLAMTLAEHLGVAPEHRVHFVRFARDRAGPDPWNGPGQNGQSAWPRASSRPGRLPAQPTALLGREAEIADCHRLLHQENVRLLVLTGPPGVGKTHLSLRLASDLSADFADGVVFVALAQIAEADGGKPRFTMLETILQYAGEQLDAAGERAEVQKRHFDWYVELANRAQPELLRANQVKWLNQIAGDLSNLRQALAWSLNNDPVAGLRIATQVSMYWRRRGHLVEGQRWLAVLLGATAPDRLTAMSPVDRLGRGLALRLVGNFAIAQGDFQVARNLLEDSLMILREVGDNSEIARALREMGRDLILTDGDPEHTRRLLEESLNLSHVDGEDPGVGWTFGYLGELAMTQRDNRRARVYVEDSLTAFQQVRDIWCVNWCHINLAYLDLMDGDTVRALSLLNDSLLLADRLGSRHHVGVVSLGLGRLASIDGRIGLAQAYLRDSVRIFHEVGTPGVYDALSFLGEIAAKQHNYSRSVRLFAVGAHHGALYVPVVCSVYAVACHSAWEACLAAARSALSDIEFAAAWAKGQSMTLEQAVSYAMSESAVDRD